MKKSFSPIIIKIKFVVTFEENSMRFDSFEDHIIFEKIRKKRREAPGYYERKYEKEISEQTPGSIHLVEDRLVTFNREERDHYHGGGRPGVVRSSPTFPGYETEWIPFSTKIKNRKPSETVMLSTKKEEVERDCCVLLIFRRKFKCTSLSDKKQWGQLKTGREKGT